MAIIKESPLGVIKRQNRSDSWCRLEWHQLRQGSCWQRGKPSDRQTTDPASEVCSNNGFSSTVI